MVWKIEVFSKHPQSSFLLERKLSLFGIDATVYFSKIYLVEGKLSKSDAEKTASRIVADPVEESYAISSGHVIAAAPSGTVMLEVTFNPGVMDTEAFSLVKAMRDMGLAVEEARTAKKYMIHTSASAEQVRRAAAKVLFNPLIEHILSKELNSLVEFRGTPYTFKRVIIPLLQADDDALMRLSKSMTLSLNLNEMRTIQKYFASLKRDPTDCELETIAQTWSEHCVHKTFKGDIEYREFTAGGKCVRKSKIKNLFKSTIQKATKKIGSSRCVSVFHDNSGVVRFDDRYHVCFKVETHNHPSALEPFGGASTGVGGVIRDIIGTGKGAYPVADTDVFCFGLPDADSRSLPDGVSHPKVIIEGVVDGVRDYGNKMGIPTVNGAILFDERYLANPLVFCGCVGIIPHDKSFKEVKEGCLIVVAGGHTGRDGIHGATFSSSELEESVNENSSFVQVGNAIEEKKMLSAIMRARDENLYTALTDCGAGGLSSAVGEIAKDFGAEVYLDKVPLKYQGLSYTEIWISESQERMVLIVRPDKLKRLQALFAEESSELAVIGTVTGTKKLKLLYKKHPVCELDMDFLHDGVPVLSRKAEWKPVKHAPFVLKQKTGDYTDILRRLLGSYNICSKEDVIRQYDHEVQGGSMVKPCAGMYSGPGDAAVVRPYPGSEKAVAIGCGINPFYSDIDPYHMAACAIDEAVRNVLCVGARFETIALLDNFCWGNPERPFDLAALVRAAQSCYDSAVALRLPFISGKDSFYNEYIHGKKRIVIPYTLLISAIGILEDYTNVYTSDFKRPGNLVYCIGMTKDELGGSALARLYGSTGTTVPQVDLALAGRVFRAVTNLTRKKLVRSLHDCSEGGLGVAVAEMSLASGNGVTVFLDEVACKGRLNDHTILFSESSSRFLAEVDPGRQKAFEKAIQGIPHGLIGCVSKEPAIKVCKGKKIVADLSIADAGKVFKEGFPPIFQYTDDHRKENR